MVKPNTTFNLSVDDIDLIEVSGGEKDFNGIITWKVNLEPNEQITKKLKFNVTHSGNVNIKK